MPENQFQNKETKETSEDLCRCQGFEHQKLVINVYVP